MTALDQLPLQIDVTELARWRHEGIPHVVLDVREPWETALCRIEDSVVAPLSTVPGVLERLPADRPIVVTCHHGMRSLQAVNWLRRNGRTGAVNLAGGIDAWARQIEPAMTLY
jgi:rhodanese-related sulfurtransferase